MWRVQDLSAALIHRSAGNSRFKRGFQHCSPVIPSVCWASFISRIAPRTPKRERLTNSDVVCSPQAQNMICSVVWIQLIVFHFSFHCFLIKPRTDTAATKKIYHCDYKARQKRWQIFRLDISGLCGLNVQRKDFFLFPLFAWAVSFRRCCRLLIVVEGVRCTIVNRRVAHQTSREGSTVLRLPLSFLHK